MEHRHKVCLDPGQKMVINRKGMAFGLEESFRIIREKKTEVYINDLIQI